MTQLLRIAGMLLETLLLSSCGIFGDDDEEAEPKELVKFDSSLQIKRLWTTKVGGESEFLLVGLRPSSDGNRIYAASQDGKVIAVDPATGKAAWKIDVETEISAGPSVGGGVVALAAKDGQIIMLDAASGAEQWRVDIGGESLAPPLVQSDSIIVQSIDNRLSALSRFDGRQRWELEQSPPVLTIRGAATPLQVGSSVIAGFDNGRLLAVNLDTGDIEWDSMLALPTGRSDLDRLSDIDGSIAIVGQDIYAGGYQGRIASIAAESGQVLWSREISTHVGVAADWNNVYTVREGGELVSLGRLNGSDVWRNDSLLRRDPTLPVPFSTTVAVGDFEGYLHFFNNLSGEPVARVRFGKSAITSEPLVVGNRLIVQSDGGSIAAYVVVDDVPKRTAPDISETADES